jgi:hypothetical protein
MKLREAADVSIVGLFCVCFIIAAGVLAYDLCTASVQRHKDQADEEKGNYGWIDKASCDSVEGWAWYPPSQGVVRVTLYYNGEKLAVATADEYRADLEANGVGDGKHAFKIPLPLKKTYCYSGCESHNLRVFIGEHQHEIGGSPYQISCTVTQ